MLTTVITGAICELSGTPAGARHLADIAPTLRVLFGLAPDRDPFAGRPLAGLFAGRKG